MERVNSSFFIVLNGFPGVGKYSIAKSMKELTPSELRMLDNHLLIDPVMAIEPERNSVHFQARKLFRLAALEGIELVMKAKKDVSFMTTSCLSDALERDQQVFLEYVAFCSRTDTTLVWINVECDQEENILRAKSEERVNGSKTKLTDSGVLIDIRSNYELLNPRVSLELEANKQLKVIFETVDVSKKSSQQSANEILQIILDSKKEP